MYYCKKLGVEILKKTFKILSIDGGGIKGIYSIAVLARLEQATGKRIIDCFDLICGTSTGGLIALLLAAGHSATEIVEFYKENASIIFPKNIVNLFGIVIGKAKFDRKPLASLLKAYLKDKEMKDSYTNLCIPAVDADNEEPMVFKTKHSSRYTRDSEIKMLDVALATSAAPLYFPKYNIEKINRNTVDGGLCANNPSLIGVIEFISVISREQPDYDNFSLLSVGNIEYNTGCFSSLKTPFVYNFSLIKNIIDLFMKLQNKMLNNITKYLCMAYNADYTRIANNDLSKDQYGKIKLDSTDNKVLDLLISKGYKDAEHMEAEIIAKGYFELKNNIQEVK